MPYSRRDLQDAYIMPPGKEVILPEHSHDLGYLSFQELPSSSLDRQYTKTLVDVIEPGGVSRPRVLLWHPVNFAPMEFEHEYGTGSANLVINQNADSIDEVRLENLSAFPVRHGVTPFFMHNDSDDISIVRHNVAVPQSAIHNLKLEMVVGLGIIGLQRYQKIRNQDQSVGEVGLILSQAFREKFADIMGRRH